MIQLRGRLNTVDPLNLIQVMLAEGKKLIITFHSYKGGTGKTLLSVNLATVYAMRGKKVCLVDLDFRAPSLCFVFKNGKRYWVNDYLNGICEVDDVLTDYSSEYVTKGKMFVGLANPATEAIREMLAKDRKWEMKALGRLLSLKRSLLNDAHLDYVIFDTSPGLQYSSINAIVSSDLAFVVTSIDKSDVMGTRRMLNELYELFEKRTGIIVNKVPFEALSPKTTKKDAIKPGTYKLPIIGTIPCFCDVLRAGGEYLFAFEKTNHPFTETLRRIATEIEHFQ